MKTLIGSLVAIFKVFSSGGSGRWGGFLTSFEALHPATPTAAPCDPPVHGNGLR